MRYLFILVVPSLIFISCTVNKPNGRILERPEVRSYNFSDGKIPKNVLESYLSRSITQAEFLVTDNFFNDGEYSYQEDDSRMLKNIGAKFIGRAIYSWNVPENFNDPAFLDNAADKIKEMHKFDPDIVFQAAIFEIISTKVNKIKIPSWVFETFDLPNKERNFSYNAMLNPDGKLVNHWSKNASVPDISQTETRMFFYYMARRYMDAGIEAIHFGQAELMSMADRDNNYKGWQKLLEKVRAAALKHARRGTIICDAHIPGGGIVIDGELLFDFVSFPLRIKEIPGDPEKAELKKYYLDAIYGKIKGGITPSGWSCEQCPYLVEFDNFGISDHPGSFDLKDHYVWGYDEISWYANQTEDYRNHFLKYANKWIKKIDLNGFIQMPGSRVISGMEENRYRANTRSESFPNGKNQEKTIKAIWGND